MKKSKKNAVGNSVSVRSVSVRGLWGESILYIRESKGYIWGIVGLFFASALFGFVFNQQLSFLNELLQELVDKTIGLNAAELTIFILQNNVQSALFSLLAGVLLGVFPIIAAVVNGTVLGFVLALSLDVAGILSWWRLLPHGVFELTAIFIALGLGLRLGATFFANVPDRFSELRRRFVKSMIVFLMVCFPLLVIAAIIEGLLIAFLR